jgi:cell division protein FtsB
LKIRLAVGVLLLGAAAYFAVFGGEYSVFELRTVRAEARLEAARLDSARAERDRLRARADSLERDSATIERVARERFGLIRPGERLYRFAERATDSVRASPADSAAASTARPD